MQVAMLLLNAGAQVDAVMESYGGGSTALGLTATSVHPVMGRRRKPAGAHAEPASPSELERARHSLLLIAARIRLGAGLARRRLEVAPRFRRACRLANKTRGIVYSAGPLHPA